jgi:hypothetical protein
MRRGRAPHHRLLRPVEMLLPDPPQRRPPMLVKEVLVRGVLEKRVKSRDERPPRRQRVQGFSIRVITAAKNKVADPRKKRFVMGPSMPNPADHLPATAINQTLSNPTAQHSTRKNGFNVVATLATTCAALFAFQFFYTSGAQVRLETACSSILNVVNPEGSTFVRHGSSLSGGDTVVRMLYAVSQPSGGTKCMVILCAFDPSNVASRVPSLSAVSVNGRHLGPARLTFLNRFWLPSEEAAASLPAGGSVLPAQSHNAPPFAPG